MLTIAVLISGSGSNLRALLEAADSADLAARVLVVGADREADGLHHAEEFGIPTFVVPWTSFATREAWGEELAAQLRVWNPDVVVLSGLMRLLPASFVRAFAPNVINTHPAYLPEFPGAHAIRDALESGASETGASIIIVDEGVDSGPILSQERVPIDPADTESTLHERVKVVERRLLIGVLRSLANGELALSVVN